jgi:FtsP/CotA-like multicopper oxidase with cupredoxin domain
LSLETIAFILSYKISSHSSWGDLEGFPSTMSTYKDYKQIPLSSGRRSLDEAGLDEKDGKYHNKDQEERLLSADDGEVADDLEFSKEELFAAGDAEAAGIPRHYVIWVSRIAWPVAASLLALVLFFVGYVVLSKYGSIRPSTDTEHPVNGDFRRPASDYILDPSWNFDATPKIRKYSWTIVDIVGNPDGVFREMITINGLFPGPMIECNEGDTIVIDVDNQSINATAIHFHGLFQNGTNHMDGVPGITQCPIAPGSKFIYKFTVSGQSGTYYYHGHQAIQTADGLYGPLVIHARDEKKLQQVPYASDRVVILQDHYHDLSSGLLEAFLQPIAEGAPTPDGALINGMNKRDCSVLPDRRCDNSSASIPSFELAANANHRLRFINVGAFAWFQISIDEHNFAITEVDGTDILPARENRMMISPAQRYSVILNTNQTTAGAFWLRARMVTNCWMHPDRLRHGAEEVKAILRYTSELSSTHWFSSQPSSMPSSKAVEVKCKDMNTSSYIPVAYEPAPATADHSYYLRTHSEIGDWKLNREFFNSSTFRANLHQPTLHRTIDGLTGQNESFNAMRSADGVNSVCYDLEHDLTIQHSGIKIVDVVVDNFHAGNHPMHLHGHKFWVLGQGHGTFPGYETLGLKLEGKGVLEGYESMLDNPIRRDVATVEGMGWLLLRFIANNPGVWAFHCHMAWHAEAGLTLQFVSRVDQLADWTIPDQNQKLCEAPAVELEKGAAPKDSIWTGFVTGD